MAISAFAQPPAISPNGDKNSSYAYGLVEKMFESCTEVKAMYCEVDKRERFDGKYVEAQSKIKMTCDPYCVYLKQLGNSGDAEILYRKDFNEGKVLVNPNGFPWFNLSLDPYGSLIRKNQHHLILDIGFSKFNTVLAHLLEKYRGEADEFVQYKNEEVISGRLCHVVDIENDNYQLIEYRTQPGETTMGISDRLKISEYRIVELNEEVDGYGELEAGMKLTIPNDYAPRIRLFIDQERFIPMRFEVYDDQGELFEAYQYDNVILNVNFSKEELTEDYPEYGF